MKSILNLGKVLILSLILWGCNPDCDMLQISDASEIQFWRTGEQTSFNLEEEGYTDEGYCFHQKFLCTSQRKLQGIDTDIETETDYYLIGFVDGVEIFNEQLTKTQDYPGSPEDIFSPYPLSGWTNKATGVGPLWTLGATPSVALTSGTIGSYALIEDIVAPEGAYNILIETQNNNAAAVLNINLKKGTTVIQNIINISVPIGSNNVAVPIDLSEWCDNIEIFAFKSSGVATDVELVSISTNIDAVPATPKVYSISFTSSDESMCDKKVQFKIFDGADPETDNELYYTDEVEFVSVWANNPGSGRVQIQYTNSKNFAGFYYDGSLSYFNIELEGRFRIERPVTAQKVLELSEVILNTATTVKIQRKLTIDDVPDYMHRKIALILAHAGSGSILINGKDWSVEESYEKSTDVPESYPLAPANIWLTEKDYYKHNII